MARAVFAQTMLVAAPAEALRAALTTLTWHDQLHPMIVSVESLPDSVAPDGSPLRRYRIVDHARMGLLTLRVRYRADVWVDASGSVVSDAYQSPGVRLHVVSRLTSEGERTRVDESVTIDAPWLLLGYVRAQAYQSHRVLFANLKRWLEADAPA